MRLNYDDLPPPASFNKVDTQAGNGNDGGGKISRLHLTTKEDKLRLLQEIADEKAQEEARTYYDQGGAPKSVRYTKVDSRIIDNCPKAPCHQNATALLLLLLQEKAWKGKKDTHHTWYHWRLNRELVVASMSHKEMARRLGVSIATIKRYLKALEDNGDIVIEIENRENVYILGEASKKGPNFDTFYYMTPKAD